MTVLPSDNWMRAMNAIAADLKAQGLEDIRGDVRVQDDAYWQGKQVRPGCYVTPGERTRTEQFSTNERDCYGYGCLVTLVRGAGDSPARSTRWAETVGRLFHKKRFWTPRTGDCLLPSVVETPVRSEDEREVLEKLSLDAISLLVRAWVLEGRM
jgi:hypothetical protein